MSESPAKPASGARLAEAWACMDAENALDPHTVEIHGKTRSRELVYAEWLTRWVRHLSPAASEELLLAARSQHICRWEIPRATYEMTRAGYLRWRADLKKFHAEKTGGILRLLGYGEEAIARVQALNLKQNLAGDAECQVLEDALCLVTLQHQLGELLAKHGPEKLVEILRKTWRKMSPAGQAEALRLSYTAEERELIGRALGEG